MTDDTPPTDTAALDPWPTPAPVPDSAYAQLAADLLARNATTTPDPR